MTPRNNKTPPAEASGAHLESSVSIVLRTVHLAGDGIERRIGVRADRLNRDDADDDDQSQHHGVFDRRRAVFTYQKMLDP